jgi:hypothetical protein
MMDFETAKALGHKRNLERYQWLLGTELTEVERQYILNRIVLETAELERLKVRAGQSGFVEPDRAIITDGSANDLDGLSQTQGGACSEAGA